MKRLVHNSLLAVTVACWGSIASAADETPPAPPPPPPAEQTDQVGNPTTADLPAIEQQAANDGDDGVKCSIASLAGDYGIQTQGSRKQGKRDVPYVSVRTVHFDGKGGTTSKGMASFGGKIVATTVDGTYQVAEDCSIFIEAIQTFGDQQQTVPYRQYGVLVAGGDEILVMLTVNNRTQLGRYEKY